MSDSSSERGETVKNFFSPSLPSDFKVSCYIDRNFFNVTLLLLLGTAGSGRQLQCLSWRERKGERMKGRERE